MKSSQISCPLNEAAYFSSDCPAVLCGSRKLSYTQLHHCVSATAQHLEKIGLKPGQRVAVVDFNRWEYLVLLLALWRMRCVACPLSYRFPHSTLINLLRNLDCQLLVSSHPEVLSSRRTPLRKLRFEDVVSFRPGTIGETPLKTFKISLDQPATIIHTSGSSGDPKAVLHTYGNHYFNALGANENMPFKPGDCWLLSLPLYHVGGLGILFRALLGKAAIVVPQKNQEPLEAILKYQITHLSLVATQLHRILQNKANLKRLSSLKAILVGGGPIPTSLFEKSLQYGLPVYLTYGLTEMASQVATSQEIVFDPSRPQVKILKHRKLKISSTGEIWVQGPALFKGYVKKGKISLPLKKGGWFPTGDMGTLDDEGCLLVAGRKDNMFISAGENIYPEEIEKKLYELGGIEKALVVPVASEEFGFRPIAFLKPKKGVKVDGARIRSSLEQSLPHFKIPDVFYEWPN